ncbi:MULTISPECIES: hypothetical protein [unclassified Paenibacillus]
MELGIFFYLQEVIAIKGWQVVVILEDAFRMSKSKRAAAKEADQYPDH